MYEEEHLTIPSVVENVENSIVENNSREYNNVEGQRVGNSKYDGGDVEMKDI